MISKSYDCFLTNWLPMTSILFLIETIYCNIFRCNYLRNKKLFQDFFFFFAFLKSRFIFESFQKKRWSFCLMYFWTYGLRKTWLDNCLKSAVSEDPSTSNMRKGPKHYWNLNDSTFTILIDHCESNSVGESLCLWYAKTIRSVSYHIGCRMTSLLFLRDGI